MNDGIIDSSVLIDCLRGRGPATAFLAACSAGPRRPRTHLLVAAELLTGARDLREQTLIDSFLATFELLVPNEADGIAALDLYRRYHLSHGVDWPDCQIAATALRLGVEVYTQNLKHFNAFGGLHAARPFERADMPGSLLRRCQVCALGATIPLGPPTSRDAAMLNHLPRHVLRILIVPLLLVVTLLAGGCANDRQVIGQANQFHENLQPAVIRDPTLANYLQQVGERIIGAAAELDKQGYGPEAHKKEDAKWMFTGMQFHFVNSKTLNAFTTGGNHMYIYTGLFQNCETEDELAAVMAHEFAHVYGRHVQKGMNRQMMTMAAAAGAGAATYAAGGKKGQQYAGTAMGLVAAAGQYMGMSYTRGDESEADKMGFRFYTRAGWEPGRFDDFFEKMIKMGYDKTPEMMSDHPSLANRVKATEERVQNLPPEAREWRRRAVAEGPELERLKRRAEEVGRNMPSSESLANAKELLAAMPRSCLTPRDQTDALPDQREAQLDLIRRAQQERQGGRARPQRAAARERQADERAARPRRLGERRGYN
jgi:predicted nucleic acid-binding protein